MLNNRNRFSVQARGPTAVSRLTGVAFAQSDRGNITGLGTDQSGAVVPAAKVTATQVTTNVARSTVASNSGEFTITNLPVGAYHVDFEASGFKH